VAENSVAYTTFGTPLSSYVSDVDFSSFINFDIYAGNTANAFTIGKCDGLLQVKTAVLDFENSSRNLWNLTIHFTDDLERTSHYYGWIYARVTDVNEPPSVGATTCSFNEHMPIGSRLCLINAIDPDNSRLNITAVGSGTSPTLFSVIEAIESGKYKYYLSNNEIIHGDVDDLTSIRITLTVVDFNSTGFPEFTAHGEFTATVVDIPDAPEYTAEIGAYYETATNIDIVTLSVFDRDTTGPYTASIVSSACTSGTLGSATFSITSSFGTASSYTGTAYIKAVNPINYEQCTSVSITFRLKDKVNTQKDYTITVPVTDVNEPPSISATYSVNENAAGVTLGDLRSKTTDPDAGQTHTYAIIDATCLAAFTIADSFYLRTKIELNYEVKNQYTCTIRVTDSGGRLADGTIGTRFSEGTVLVNV